ncbi:MAG: tetratricopeptide repeat protein [Brevinematia bacterium]
MYGRFLKSLPVAFSLVFFLTPLFSLSMGEKFSVNGYYFLSYNKNIGLGLRAKAIGDTYYKSANYSRAIQYYERAIKYIPNEADLYFNLGNIYASHKVYNIAIRYYKIASEKYTLPENFGKTQKNYYLSLIRYAFSLQKLKDYDDNEKKARQIVSKLAEYSKEISEKFPEIQPELEKLYILVYGTTTVISMNQK